MQSRMFEMAPTVEIAALRQSRFDLSFTADCSVGQLYLVISDADSRVIAVHQMDRIDRGRWSVSLSLARGTYQYRYGAVQQAVLPSDAEQTRLLAIIESADCPLYVPGHCRFKDRPAFVHATIDTDECASEEDLCTLFEPVNPVICRDFHC